MFVLSGRGLKLCLGANTNAKQYQVHTGEPLTHHCLTHRCLTRVRSKR